MKSLIQPPIKQTTQDRWPVAVSVIKGEVLNNAVLDARDMCSMNFAREELNKLEKILLTFVIPAMGGYENEMACNIARHLEQIRIFSGNFCWRHRHLGASHGEIGRHAKSVDSSVGGAV